MKTVPPADPRLPWSHPRTPESLCHRRTAAHALLQLPDKCSCLGLVPYHCLEIKTFLKTAFFVNWRKKGKGMVCNQPRYSAPWVPGGWYHTAIASTVFSIWHQRADGLSTGEPTQQPSRARLWLFLPYTSVSRAACGWFSLVGRNSHVYCYWQCRYNIRAFQKDWKIGSAFIFQLGQPLLHQLCLAFLQATHIRHHCALQPPVTINCPPVLLFEDRTPSSVVEIRPNASLAFFCISLTLEYGLFPTAPNRCCSPGKQWALSPLTWCKQRVMLAFKAASFIKIQIIASDAAV